MSGGAPVSRLIGEMQAEMQGLFEFLLRSTWAQKRDLPTANDFVVGNPHEMPIPGIAEALIRAAEPRNKDWFAYKMSEEASRQTVAEALRASHGLDFTDDHVFMTSGAFAGIAITLKAVVDPGDEVVYMTPPWFFYHPIIRSVGGVPVPVRVKADDFDLDLDAIAGAITERTRAVIVNSPNNPTGRIYPAETLDGLAEILERAGERNGRPIYLLSDEAYNRIVYSEATFESPLRHYPRTLLIYTYGKTLLAPGLRMGYVAVRPDMPDREQLWPAMFMAATTMGWAFPVSLPQQALGQLNALSIDLAHLEAKRDRMVAGLRDAGYELHVPEGTFYLLPKSPIADDLAFTERLAQREVYVLPGTLIDHPGHFRISLTANDEMIERALPVFAEVRATIQA